MSDKRPTYRTSKDAEGNITVHAVNDEAKEDLRRIRTLRSLEEIERAERLRILDAIEAARSEFELRNVIAKERAK